MTAQAQLRYTCIDRFNAALNKYSDIIAKCITNPNAEVATREQYLNAAAQRRLMRNANNVRDKPTQA